MVGGYVKVIVPWWFLYSKPRKLWFAHNLNQVEPTTEVQDCVWTNNQNVAVSKKQKLCAETLRINGSTSTGWNNETMLVYFSSQGHFCLFSCNSFLCLSHGAQPLTSQPSRFLYVSWLFLRSDMLSPVTRLTVLLLTFYFIHNSPWLLVSPAASAGLCVYLFNVFRFLLTVLFFINSLFFFNSISDQLRDLKDPASFLCDVTHGFSETNRVHEL